MGCKKLNKQYLKKKEKKSYGTCYTKVVQNGILNNFFIVICCTNIDSFGVI